MLWQSSSSVQSRNRMMPHLEQGPVTFQESPATTELEPVETTQSSCQRHQSLCASSSSSTSSPVNQKQQLILFLKKLSQQSLLLQSVFTRLWSILALKFLSSLLATMLIWPLLCTFMILNSWSFQTGQAGVTIPKKTLQELIDKALIESLAQKQRDLLNLDESSENSLEDGDPEELPGFYEGDMAGADDLGRVGINFAKFPSRKWKNNTVPYIISPMYLPDEYQILKTAIRILDFYTCIDFREWNGKDPDYLVFWPVEKPAGCWSYVGRVGGPQIISLQPPDLVSPQCFSGIGRPLHETMHALGVYHEQSRPDRDKYISLEKKNVLKGFLSNFDKVHAENATSPYEYDYNSIMHYGPTFFSKNKRIATLVPKMKGHKIGQRVNLSRLDCLKLNYMYGCLDDSRPFDKRKYTTICDYLGL